MYSLNMNGLEAAPLSLESLNKEITDIKDELHEVNINNKKLRRLITKLTLEKEHLVDKIYDIEVNIMNVDQYSRRSNVEICNVPEKIVQKNLEVYVLKFLESIGINLQSYDLVAVHRVGRFIKGRNRNVIVRFINRKNAYRCIRDSHKSKRSKNVDYRKLYVIENLCPANKNIFNFLYKLKKLEKIKNVWSYNGSVSYQLIDSVDDSSERADHMDDLEYMYDEFDLYYDSESSEDEP